MKLLLGLLFTINSVLIAMEQKNNSESPQSEFAFLFEIIERTQKANAEKAAQQNNTAQQSDSKDPKQ